MSFVCSKCKGLVKEAEKLLVTKCGHMYHSDCLRGSTSCPLCKNVIRDEHLGHDYPQKGIDRLETSFMNFHKKINHVLQNTQEEILKSVEQDENILSVNKLMKYVRSPVNMHKATARTNNVTHFEACDLGIRKIIKENEKLKKEFQLLCNVNIVSDGIKEMKKDQNILQRDKDADTLNADVTHASTVKRATSASKENYKETHQQLRSLDVDLDKGRQTKQRFQRKLDKAQPDVHKRCNIKHVQDKEKIISNSRSTTRKRRRDLDADVTMENSDVDSSKLRPANTTAKLPDASAPTSLRNRPITRNSISRTKAPPLNKQNLVPNKGTPKASRDGLAGAKNLVLPRYITRSVTRLIEDASPQRPKHDKSEMLQN